VRGFKIGVTQWLRLHTDVRIVWQRTYCEHIIRNERSLKRILAYIACNPLRWDLDPENLAIRCPSSTSNPQQQPPVALVRLGPIA